MNTRKHLFFLPVIAVILGTWGTSYAKQLLDEPAAPAVIASANPALEGIKKVYVIIEPTDATAGKDGLIWKDLQDKTEQKLNDAGIEIAPGVYLGKGFKEHDIPELRISMEMIKLTDVQLYVFRIQTSLAAKAHLQEQRLYFKADVWKSQPIMRAESISEMPDAVTGVILDQVQDFIFALNDANKQRARVADTNNTSAVPPVLLKQQRKQKAKPEPAKYKYVASRKSKVFHYANCPWVKNIKPENKVTYNKRDDAIKDGKRPCSRCKP